MGAGCLGMGCRVLIGASALLSLMQSLPGTNSANVSKGRSWYDDCGIQEQLAQGMAEVKAKDISEDQKRCLQVVCSLSSNGATPTKAEEKGCLRLCSWSLGSSSSGVLIEIQANLERFVSDEQCSCPPCATKGSAGDTRPQTPSSPAPWDKNILKTSSKAALGASNRKSEAPRGWGDGAHRASHKASVMTVSSESSGSPSSCLWWPREPGKTDESALQQGNSSAETPCRLKKSIPCCDVGLHCSEEDLVSMLLLSPSDPPPGTSCTCSRPASRCHPASCCPPTQRPPEAIPVTHLDDARHLVTCCILETNLQAPPTLGFRVQMASRTALCLLVDFGDSFEAEMKLYTMTDVTTMTAYHQYRKEGFYKLKAVVHDFHGTDVELGPYYVEIGHENVSVFMNSSTIHQGEALFFAESLSKQKGTIVMHSFSSISSYNVSFISQTHVGSSQVTISYKMQSVSVYTNGTVFSADTDITFVAVTQETTPLEFTWYFGDNPQVKTTSRSIRRRLSIPQWYHIMVKASSRIGSVLSEPHIIRVQKRIIANRLMSTSSALVNSSVSFECRLNFGTDVAYLWNFGDGAISLGSSSTSHVYSREGEFTVEVLAFNNISSAALRKQLFIVCEPCQPPPVKNMGPLKVQIWKSQPLRLGVTFEAAVLCNISQGLFYTWSIMDAEGSFVTLPAATNAHRQTFMLPSYTLECGNYTAIAKVQIKGSVVYSNYCVGVEVRARTPVSVISEGTHIFIPRATSMPVVLRGSQSYDPDNPGATLRYHWTCTTTSLPGWPCFDDSAAHQVDTKAPSISFPAKWLSECCDQFLVTLTVSSNGHSSSQAQMFLSTRPDPAFRFVHISWINFKDVHVNWNEELSFQAMCEDCGDAQDLSYTWDLFLVNATEKSRMEVPFCSTVGLLGTSALGGVVKFSESDLQENPSGSLASHSQEPLPRTLGWPAPSILGRTSADSMMASHQIPAAGLMAGPEELSGDGSLTPESGFLDEEALTVNTPEGSWPLPSFSPAFDEFEAYYGDIQEAVPPRGRQPGNSTNLLGSEASMSAEESPSDGDNLLGPFLHTSRAEPALMTDWAKTLVSPAVFRGYTSSGITEPVVTIEPYSLSSGKTYVLQASVASKHGLLGKAQLYLKVNQAPQDMACQVQPHHGMEAHTIFSVFCMSGKPDFHYEFRYRIGNASSHTLYRGRDTQYYFSLPAGETSDNYKVIISTEITDGQGSKVRPCTVVVTVLPRYHGNTCPDEDLYHSSLRNLSTLQLVGSYMDIRNYITMITGILRRLAKENRNASCDLWSQIQDVLISSACQLPFTDQEAVMDSIQLLRELISFPNKLSFMSAVCILKYTRMFLAQGQLPGGFVINKNLGLRLVLLISGVWEAAKQEKMRNEDYLQEEGTRIISDALLTHLSLSKEHQLHMSTGKMEFWTVLHHTLQSSVQNLGFVCVHLPGDLVWHSAAQEETQSPCYISQLMFFMKSPYPGGRAPGQVGGVLSLILYSCSSRRPIRRGRLETPVTVEFGEEDHPLQKNTTMFALLRDEVNLHRFVGLSENPQESLQIHIEFSKPITRAFPVMLLVRFSEKPTPSDFLVKQIYFWDEQTVQIYIPAVPRKGSNVGYLSLLDADYDRKPPNKYFARAMNYTVHFQWIQCVFWDKTEWRSENFSPQPGTSGKINCSYHRLAPFSVLRRKLNSSFEVNSISKFQSHPQNLLPSILTVVFVVLYGCLVTKSRCVDHCERKKTGCIFLKEDTAPGHQLYAVVIDTGFRSPAQFTSKVFLVLCGENGLSETKELCCPDRRLFERNSRHTFVLSAPNQLGPLRKIHLWHDSSGPSPSWFISHVMVKELYSEQGWFFPAQCWLAVNRCDGRVQRELTCLHHGLGFWKLFYSKFTEYLEDFHTWLSPFSQPPSSSYLHTQRLAVSFCSLCLYACLTALVTVGGHEQHPLDVGPTDVTLGTFILGLLCTLLASPSAQLLSLLFRRSKEAIGHHSWAAPQRPLREATIEASQGLDCGESPGSREPSEHPESHVLSGRDRAWRTAARGSGEACPSSPLEACEEEELTLREKSHHSPPCVQAPNSDSEGCGLQWSKARQPWSSSVAWIICCSVSLACGFGTGFLGYRFVPAQYRWWLHLLSLSVVCCVFVTQPLMIGVAALAFAWKRKDDSQFFTESLCDATKDLDLELEYSRTHDSPSSIYCAPEAEKILAARQRKRHLRWVQPPSAAQLRVTRERLRKESRVQAALRAIGVHSLLLLQLLIITYGRFCPGEHSLNQAIRKEFTRNVGRSLEDLSSTDDWWDWTLSTMLDGLYPQGPSGGAWEAQPGTLGQCHLIGPSVIMQLKASSGPVCKNSELDFENRNVTPGGPESCRVRRESYMHSLGKTRREAHAALTTLRASRWISRNTRTVSVHFTLYNPPTQLFTSVTLGAEVLPTGGLVPWSLVESFSIFRRDSARQYHLVLSELVFLVFNMTHLCFQLWKMATKGVLSYWRKPRHWLEFSVIGVALAYCAASGHLTTLAGDITDEFRKGLCQVFVDFSLMALWNQRARWLQGILLFLSMWKCLLLLGFLNTTASFSPVIRPSFLRLFAPALTGTLLLAVHCHLCRFLLFTWTLSSGTSADGVPELLFGFLGRSPKDSWHNLLESNRRAMAFYCGVLFLLATTLCFRMLRASLVTFFRKRKSIHRKSLVTRKDVAVYLWQKGLTFLGLETPEVEETEVTTDHNCYLDEFSSLLDELLMKINNLSDSLELSILEEQLRRPVESKAECSPSVGIQGTKLPGARYSARG